MQLIATKEFTYADVPRKPGDRFRASAEDARLLKGFGKAIDAPASGTIQTKQEVATDDDGTGGTGAQRARGNKRGRYNRTDMRAQE